MMLNVHLKKITKSLQPGDATDKNTRIAFSTVK